MGTGRAEPKYATTHICSMHQFTGPDRKKVDPSLNPDLDEVDGFLIALRDAEAMPLVSARPGGKCALHSSTIPERLSGAEICSCEACDAGFCSLAPGSTSARTPYISKNAPATVAGHLEPHTNAWDGTHHK